MRSLVVELLEDGEIIQAREIKGDDNWMERYVEAVQDYTGKMLTNDRLRINIEQAYKTQNA